MGIAYENLLLNGGSVAQLTETIHIRYVQLASVINHRNAELYHVIKITNSLQKVATYLDKIENQLVVTQSRDSHQETVQQIFDYMREKQLELDNLQIRVKFNILLYSFMNV